jgi:leader peptidase (prepilin peptidase)/N-methyltransferase
MNISLRYPAVELATGCTFALIAVRFGPTWMSLLLMGFAAGLITAAMIDFDIQIIPDEISLGGLVLGLVSMPLARYAGGLPLVQAYAESVVGALLGGGCLWIVGFLHARISAAFGRTFAHWPGEGEELPRPSEPDYWLWFPGLGLGDIKLLAMIGAFVGPVGVMTTILAASLFGLAMGLLWAAVHRSWRAPFGFGPAIAAGALLALLIPRGLLLF